MKDVIWIGSEQTFTSSQLKSAKMFGDDYWSIVSLFVSNIQAYYGRWRYVIHHIDGNHENNHPSNLMLMTLRAHITLHHKIRSPEDKQILNAKIAKTVRETCAKRTPDEKRLHSEATVRGMTQEVKERMSKNVLLGLANMTPEAEDIRRERLSINVSKARGGQALRGMEFLRNTLEPFTIGDFNGTAQYAQHCTAQKFLNACYNDELIIKIGKSGRSFLYQSLICEVKT